MKKIFILLLIIVLSGCTVESEETQFEIEQYEYLMGSYDFCMSLGDYGVELIPTCTQYSAEYFNEWNNVVADVHKINNKNWIIWKRDD